MSLPLRIAFSENPMVQPLKDGRVKPNNIELDFVTVDHPGDLFYHNLKHDEFDVSEMGIPWTIRALEMSGNKRWDWAKLPVFLSRGTGWTNLYVNTASGIKSLQDLKGKKICVPEYNMSMSMWLRVIMKDFFGIKPEENVWYLGRTKARNQGGALGAMTSRTLSGRFGLPKNKRLMACSKQARSTQRLFIQVRLVLIPSIDTVAHPYPTIQKFGSCFRTTARV